MQALVGDIVLCSWARHFTLTVPLSTHTCKRNSEGYPCDLLASNPSREEVEKFLVASCYRNWDKVRADRLPASYMCTDMCTDILGPSSSIPLTVTLFVNPQRSKRRRVLQLISSYLELCEEREDIMRQMQLWIESTVDEELMKPARVFLFSPELLLDDLPLELTSEIQTLGATLLRLKNIADSLGIGGSNRIDDEDEISDKPLTKARGPLKQKTVYSCKCILAIPLCISCLVT